MDLRARLSHVLWLGGGPRVGKTTLSRLLAGKYDLKIYNLDWHHVRDHQTRPGGVPAYWKDQTMDERWVLPPPPQMAEREAENWTARFPLVVEDLLALPAMRPIVAEGPSAFPWCVAPLVRDARQALFLVATAELWDRVLARRLRGTPVGRRMVDGTSDPERALANIRGRDLLLGERTRASCEELGLRCVVLDGSLDLDDSLALVEEHFRPHLPETPNV